MPKLSSFHTIITQLSNCVSTLSPAAIHSFNLLYRGEKEKEPELSDDSGNEINVISITNILNSTNNPLIRAKKIIELIEKIFLAVEKAINDFKNFQRSDETKKKFVEWSEDHLKTCIEGCLLLKEALDNGVFPSKKIKEEKVAKRMVNFFLGWKNNESIMSDKLGEFDTEKDVINVALFQQLCGGIPIAPIADSIMPFNILDWQKNMFLALRKKVNVIVSAPTSSGKTMISLGYIIAFLQNEPKSILVYIVPNNVLALEICAILNRFIEGKVSTILDKDSERKQDERTIVLTPSGAMQSGFIDTELPKNALLIIDEIHTIMQNIELENCLRKMSNVQTLLLSATISDTIIEKLGELINNGRENVIIKENTQFIVAQDIIPRWCSGSGSGSKDDRINLLPINPICNMNSMNDVENHNLSLTARDVTILFNKIVKTFGVDGTPEYLAPIPFFYIYGCQKPEKIIFLDEDESDDESDDEKSKADVGGIVKRLSMNDIQKWQSCLIEFLIEKSNESIIQSYQSIVNNKQITLECTPKNAFLVIEECKKKDMFPALFFFKSLYGAIYYTSEIIKLLDNKQQDIVVRDKKSNVKLLEKQIASLSKMKGNGKELRARRELMEFQLQQSMHSEMIAVSDYKCLSKDGGISPEAFNKYVEMLKNWNKKFTQSHLLAQMVLYGIGILSGDMPFDIQVFIRGLFNSGIISLLMTTTDCAYGINTPTKTVIVSDGISEIDRKQMKGRAGRKGLGFRAYFISFGRGNDKSLVTPPCEGNSDSIIPTSYDLDGDMGEIGFPQIYHYDATVYSQFLENDWINKDVQHILFLKNGEDNEIEIDNEFYKKSYLLFGLGAILAPSILSELIKSIKIGESNRNIRIILGLIGCIPQNKPYQNKQDWNFTISEKVIQIYEKNGIQNYRPNWFAYQWLMNQKNDFSFSEKEECIKNGKYWSYLFFLLSPIFRKILGENKGDELYYDIQGLITNSIINM
jgi:hypothetical protein